MNLSDLIKDYKTYGQRQGLKTFFHKTHLSLMACKIGDLISMCRNSGDRGTDRASRAFVDVADLYTELDRHTKDYHDESVPFSLMNDNKVPVVFIESLVDLFLQILIYIGGNDLESEFTKRLEQRVLADKEVGLNIKGRFQNNRIGWQESAKKQGG